ncbi:MAG: class I SAM-dependent methyltransferase [Burkholderiales bacterium]|nr:class I SAM-dependent methyltransferase [Burkholderiales bacterium]
MNSTTASRMTLPRSAPASARSVLRLLERLRHGTLSLQLPDGTQLRYGKGDAPHASLVLHDWAVFGATIKSGDIGFAESYMAGQWSSHDLAALLRLFIRNRQDLEDLVYGSWLGSLYYRLRHLFHRNTKANSRKNIHAHYDLGNAFYRLWLDETMNYSSAWFEGNPAGDMVAAQQAKVRRALRMAGVQPGDRVLEIGCGWGALAEMAVSDFQARISGVTLSTEQLAWAQERVGRLGPEAAARADLRLQDYRDINDGPYDAICSIEMVEAVGREYWPVYFETVSRLLRPGGRACIQSIVIDDRLFERYVRSTDFIQQYIFPGGCLPCPAEFRRQAAAAGLRVADELCFGADYAETLRRWRRQFLTERSRILQLGFDERFMRLWEFYLAYCEAAFDEANIDVVQYTLQKV